MLVCSVQFVGGGCGRPCGCLICCSLLWQDLVSVSGLGGFALLCAGLALTVAAARCVLFLLTSPLWFGQAAYLSHQCSYRI